ncbi:hypothetical protein D3C85_1865710 [compost metagenome]
MNALLPVGRMVCADNLAHSKNIGMIPLGLLYQTAGHSVGICIEFKFNLMQTGGGVGGPCAVIMLVQISFKTNVIG